MLGTIQAFWRKTKRMKKANWLKIYNFWPPFLGAGIRISDVSDDVQSVEVKLHERFWNRNHMNAHFGGSICAMTDPFYALIITKNLGKDYIVWDKAASIRFKKPGKGTLTATFNVSSARLAEIKHEADTQYKAEPHFTAVVRDEAGDVVAEVDKIVHVRRRDRESAKIAPAPAPAPAPHGPP